MNRKAYLAAGTPRDGYQRLPGTPRAPLKAVCPDVQVKRRLALTAGWVSRATRWPATSNSRFRGCFPDMHHSARLSMTSVFRAVCLCPHTLNVPLHSASEPSERGSLAKLRSHVLSRIHCAGAMQRIWSLDSREDAPVQGVVCRRQLILLIALL